MYAGNGMTPLDLLPTPQWNLAYVLWMLSVLDGYTVQDGRQGTSDDTFRTC